MSGQADAPGGGPREADGPGRGTPDDGARIPVAERDGVGVAQSAPGDAAGAPGGEPLADEPADGIAGDARGTADPTIAAGDDAPADGGEGGVEVHATPDGPDVAPGATGGTSRADASPAPGADSGAVAGDAQAGPDPEASSGAADDAVDPALLAEGARIAEALIFASDRPVTPAMLGAVLPPGLAPGAVVAALAAACEGRGVAIAEVAGGWAFRTAPDLAQRLTKVVQAPRRLPRAAMEALSIIAYHQPCTRGEIEEIRGAALAQTTLEALLELGLVAPRGRREVPGRPTLWGTTPKFLEQFGLKALSDLPRKEELVTAETGPALPLGGAVEALPADETAPEAAGPPPVEPDPAPPQDQAGAPASDTAAGTAP